MKMAVTASLVVAIALVALAGAVFGLSAAYAQDSTTTYTVTHVNVDGNRDSAQAVRDANKTPSGIDSGRHEVSLDGEATSAEILAAADALSTHSITTDSRYIDASGEVHNFRSGKRTYWQIVKQAAVQASEPTPAPTSTYTVTHVNVDGNRDSAQAVKEANKTPSGASSGHHEFTLNADATDAEILAEADALSTHSITTNSRYIDASGEVHNFQSGKRTYWLITKSEVNVAEPPEEDPDRQNVGVNTLTLTGTIADQILTKGVSYTSATAFPEATGIDGTVTYSVANLPSGITLNADRKLTGTATEYQIDMELTYTATDTDGDTATLTFYLAVVPKATTLTATAGNGQVTLSWTAIPGVSHWEYSQNPETTTERDVPGSSGSTASHTVSGLTNSTAYTFSVYAVVVMPDDDIYGVVSITKTATPLSTLDNVPYLGTVDDEVFVQGAAVDFTLPAAHGGDGHPSYAYTLTPAVPGLTLDASTRKLTGTPTTSQAKTTHTYKAEEKATADSTPESDSTTFTIGIQPKKPASLTAASGDAQVTLSWTAIAGVASWQIKQDSGSWTAIASSGAATNSHTVTGLTNGTAYTFQVRALVGTGGAKVEGVASDAASVTPADLVPALTGIADKLFVQGTAVDFTLPAATGGDGHPSYAYTLTPNVSTGSGLAFTASTRKLTGTPSAPKAKISYTYKAEESSDPDSTNESASKTFTIGIQPQKPAGFTATTGDTEVTLRWTAIAGVASWEVKQDIGSWTAIASSGAATNSHTVTSLTNGTAYTFQVRALVGDSSATPSTQVIGVASDAALVTPADLVPALTAITDKLFVQGTAVDLTLPAATGGDGDLNYTLTPNVSGIGLAFTASTHKLTGTPSAPKAKVTYTYTATEDNDPDSTNESDSTTFTIGIQPKKPANFTATAGDTEVTLGWTAIAGVASWEVKQDSSSWTAISGSTDATTSHTVTSLTNGTEYTFNVRALVGTGGAKVEGVESDTEPATPAVDLVPALTSIADQLYVQGAAVDITLPAATSGDGHPNYDYTLSPAVPGLTFTESTRKLTGTPSTPQGKTTSTYKAEESADPDSTTESDSKTFTIGVQPQKPANFTATAGDTEVTLGWTAIAGVASWEVKQDSGSWTAIASSSAATNSRTVTSLTNGTSYSFKVRALVGDSSATPSTQVIGVESDAASVTPAADLVPALTSIADQTYVQGAAVDFTLPAATGGDGHPSYAYTLTPAVSDSRLPFTASTRKLTGTPYTPQGKVEYTYKATESADPDGTTESASTTFTIGIQPNKPAGFTAASGDAQVTLSWTAIAGVSGWEVKQDSGSWTAIATSGAATNSHTVTGLTNGTEYSFKVQAFVSSGATRVGGIASDTIVATPIGPPTFYDQIAADGFTKIPAKIDAQEYNQGVEVHTLFPRAKPANPDNGFPHLRYYMSPRSSSGLDFNPAPPLAGWHGTPDTPQAVTTYTYSVREDNGVGSASLTFTASVKPRKPALKATRTATTADLSWDSNSGVSGWEYSQDDGTTWAAITGSDDTTTTHTIEGLVDGQTYYFKVRAFVGTGDAKVTGVESNRSPGGLPVFSGAIADQEYTQGVAVSASFPRARTADGGTWFRLRFSLSPTLPSGLTADLGPPTLGWSGTPDTPLAVTTYAFRAQEKTGGLTAELRFTVSVKPKKTDTFSAEAGAGKATLSWTAIAGVDGWEYKQANGTLIGPWTAITGSNAATNTYTVTGLNANEPYSFKVRAFVGTGDTRVDGVESDAANVTTPN